MPSTIDLDAVAFGTGGYLLVKQALAELPVGGELLVRGQSAGLSVELDAWCRRAGHGRRSSELGKVVVKGRAEQDRWLGAERAGRPDAAGAALRANPSWGLAARGALVESGGPPLAVDILERDVLWADAAPRLYRAALARQWNPESAVDWEAVFQLPPVVEAAVVQVMTYLVENEQAALVVPARFLSRIHPHFREVMQILAAQVADEARHIEVFTRRALLHSQDMGVSTVGGRASLQTLLEENDFSLASFLLSVLGEGTFLNLLTFLARHAPDPVTRRVCELVVQDEARHVAFGVAHLRHAVDLERGLLSRLRLAVEQRHDALVDTAGLNEEVFDSLVLIAAHEWNPEALGRGWKAVQQLQKDMDEGRQRRLIHVGFPADEAAELSALHTRNFM